MAASVNPVPPGYHTVTPYLTCPDTARAIEFYKKAFGAIEIFLMNGPDGKVAHAEIKIGDSMLMLGDEWPGNQARSPQSIGGSAVTIFLYVEDVDSTFDAALKAGAKAEKAPEDMFWGDRFGKLVDPFGHLWGLATHIEDVAPEEMKKRAAAVMSQAAAQAS